jgi:hypothetical protein
LITGLHAIFVFAQIVQYLLSVIIKLKKYRQCFPIINKNKKMKLAKKTGLLAVLVAIALSAVIFVNTSSQVSAKAKKVGVNLTGSWSGTYWITSPKGCKGMAGTWTADVVQTNNVFTGNYDSDLVYGTVSGYRTSAKKFTWTVHGDGIVKIAGKVNSSTTVSGKITSSNCPGTHKKMKGSFSGTKLLAD